MGPTPAVRAPESRFARSGSAFYSEAADDAAPLHDACQHGNVDEIIRLLKLQPQESAIEEAHAGIPPLLFAARAGQLEAVSALLERSANVNATAITNASAWSVSSVAQWCAIHTAAQQGDSEMLGLLLERDDCDISARATRGSTALHFAAYYGRLPAVQLLVAHGADVQAKCDDGFTALDDTHERRKFARLVYIYGRSNSRRATPSNATCLIPVAGLQVRLRIADAISV